MAAGKRLMRFVDCFGYCLTAYLAMTNKKKVCGLLRYVQLTLQPRNDSKLMRFVDWCRNKIFMLSGMKIVA